MMQAYSPHPGVVQQHPGVPQGHPMAGVQHNPGQAGPGMPQGMHMGVSGPGGPQVSQAGALMAGMPPGQGGPSAHALQHLNPGQAQQAQMYQQQQAMAFANNPQLAQQMQQQQIMQQQRQQQVARQALMAQQYNGAMPVMPNGMSPMNAAHLAAMRGAPMARPVNLPQHLAHAQQQAQQTLEHQQAQQQAQHQQQLMAQHMAMQQQQNAQQGGNNNQGQQQMNPQQLQSMQHAQIAAAQQHQQQQAQAQAAAQQSQTQNQPQPQPQQPQQNPQSQPQQQPQPQGPQPNQQAGIQQQQAAAQAAAMLQQRQGEKLKGQCLMRLMLFGDHLSNFGLQKGRDDLNYWVNFVDRFFSPRGVFRHSVLIVESAETSSKQYEITFPALARYFYTHFESGIRNMQMIVERATEKELPNNTHFIESQKSSFIYWFHSGSQLIASGTLRALFDAEQKLELLEFVTNSHEEYLPRAKIIDAARPLHEWQKEWHKVNPPSDGKSSPEMNKKGKTKPMKSPPQPPPEIDLPASKIKPSMGITPSVFRFLELAEVIGQMNPLFNFSHLHPSLGPNAALDQYVATVAAQNVSVNMQNPVGPRTPGMSNFPLGASPATQHLTLPDGSPHIGSPAQSQNMQLQQSQQGTVSSGPSANTSPNTSNKRRRPSTVKEEGDTMVNGVGGAKPGVKPSPRIGGKRQKGNPA